MHRKPLTILLRRGPTCAGTRFPLCRRVCPETNFPVFRGGTLWFCDCPCHGPFRLFLSIEKGDSQ